jgi:hypothetical protein
MSMTPLIRGAAGREASGVARDSNPSDAARACPLHFDHTRPFLPGVPAPRSPRPRRKPHHLDDGPRGRTGILWTGALTLRRDSA